MSRPPTSAGRRLGVRNPPRQPRSEDTRTRLLDAAIECFSRYGVAATSTASIARRAGVTRGAYLHHFGSREDLVAAAIAHLMAQSMARIEETITGLFTRPPTAGMLVDVWRTVYPDSYLAGYEMMLLARHEPRLARLWRRHSRDLARRRREILLTLFDAQLVDERVSPFLEGFADLFRGIKLMEVVRSEPETLRVIHTMAPMLIAEIEALQAEVSCG